MKLIIDIPGEKDFIDKALWGGIDAFDTDDLVIVLDAISRGIPLDENKGEWIEAVTERFPNGEKRMWHYECSACSTGEPPCPINKEHWDFCPNCGADMRGE